MNTLSIQIDQLVKCILFVNLIILAVVIHILIRISIK